MATDVAIRATGVVRANGGQRSGLQRGRLIERTLRCGLEIEDAGRDFPCGGLLGSNQADARPEARRSMTTTAGATVPHGRNPPYCNGRR